jgi:hypothetical protein
VNGFVRKQHGPALQVSIRSFLDDDVLIGFLVDRLPAMYAKDHFGHRDISPSAGSELDGEAQCTIFFWSGFYIRPIGRRNFTES